jgi:hypothetical protein
MESLRASIVPSEPASAIDATLSGSAAVAAADAGMPSAAALAQDKRAVYIRTVVGISLGIIRSIALGHYLLPEDVSAYRLSTVWAGYFGFLALGTGDALHFLGPALHRRAEWKELSEFRGVAFTMSLLAATSALIGVVVLTVGLRLAAPTSALLLGALAFVVSLTPYLNIELWVAGQFRRQARVDLTGAVVGTIASLAGLVAAGLPGFLVGNLLGAVASFAMARDAIALRDLLPRAVNAYRRSIQFGFVQTVLVLAQGAVVSADIQTLAFLPAARHRLGVYSFASMLAVAIRTAATAGAIVSQTTYLASQRGPMHDASAANDEIEGLRRVDTVLAMLFSLFALVAVTALAPTLFPRFRDVVEPLVGMTIATATLRWGFFHAVALSAQRRQWRIVPWAGAGIVVTVAWTDASVQAGWSLVLLSLAPAIGAAVYSVGTVLVYERTTAEPGLAMRWANASLRHMLVLVLAELPLLAIRGDRVWYVNAMIASGSLVLLIVLLIAVDRPTSHTLRALAASMLHDMPLVRTLFGRSPSGRTG